MSKPLDKFQDLLRELFQFDCADLDFGIYRIMNHKRAVIEQFIMQDLPKAVAEELGRGALAEQSQAAGELKEIAASRMEMLCLSRFRVIPKSEGSDIPRNKKLATLKQTQ